MTLFKRVISVMSVMDTSNISPPRVKCEFHDISDSYVTLKIGSHTDKNKLE